MPFTSKKQMAAAFGGYLGKKMQSKAPEWAKKTKNIKKLPTRVKKENMEMPGPGYDNQIGDIYAVQKPVTHDCACTDLIHKIDPMTGIQSMGMEPDQIHGIYNDEMVANQIAEKIHKEFVDAALALEKKKHAVIEKIKKTMNKLEKARTERMGMIKENPLAAQDHKDKVAEYTHKLDELTTKLEMIEKSKKNIQKKEDEKKDLKESSLNIGDNLQVGDKFIKIGNNKQVLTIKKIEGDKVFVESDIIPGKLWQWPKEIFDADVKSGNLKWQPKQKDN